MHNAFYFVILTLIIGLIVAGVANARKAPLPVALGLWVMFSAFLWWPFIAPQWMLSTQTTDADVGKFGDMFGPLTSLFSALAVAGVAFTLWFERDTNKSQRAESAAQQSLLKQQAFESTYFNLARQYRETRPTRLRDLDLNDHDLRHVVNETVYSLLDISHEFPNYGVEVLSEIVWDNVYGPLYEKNADQLGPYFRGLYHWFKFIDQADLRDEEKQRYANIARAQLGNSELMLLSINCLTQVGDGLKKYVVKYGLLKHLVDPQRDLMIEEVMRGRYPASAFGNE